MAVKRGTLIIKFIETLCMVPEGARVGQPIKLDKFQKKFIKDVYDKKNVRNAYLSIARKNGKTTLIACILLAHLVGPVAVPNSQIISGARSRDQAAIVFDLACKIINQSPALRDIIRIIPSSKRLFGLIRNVEYRALSAEGKTAHGLSPILAILDEVGQVKGPRDEFIEAIETSQGAHAAPLLIAISTQAPTDGDLFSIWLDDAAKSKDESIVSHVYAADPEDNILDPSTWKKANPALGLFRSVDDMRLQAEKAHRMPSSEQTFRNLCLNQRVSAVAPFVSKSAWDACQNETFSPHDGVSYAGLDLSMRTDLTSFVVVRECEEGVYVYPYFWTPEQGLLDRAYKDRVPYDVWVKKGYIRTVPGATVDYGYVARDIMELYEFHDVSVVGFDRWRIDILRKEFSHINQNPNLESFGQGFKDMSPAIEDLESLILNKRLVHDGNPVLKMCIANSVVTMDPTGARKLDKHKATGRIDGAVALAMACGMRVRGNSNDVLTSPWEDEDFTINIK